MKTTPQRLLPVILSASEGSAFALGINAYEPMQILS